MPAGISSKNLPKRQCAARGCTAIFIPKQERQRFCSKKCNSRETAYRLSQAKKPPLLSKECKQCGKAFSTRRESQAYCSERCKIKARGRRQYPGIVHAVKRCRTCGSEFQPDRSCGKYCSSYCRNRFYAIRRKETEPEKVRESARRASKKWRLNNIEMARAIDRLCQQRRREANPEKVRLQNLQAARRHTLKRRRKRRLEKSAARTAQILLVVPTLTESVDE